MTAEDLIAALALPASCRVNRRVPKKLLLEHGAFGAGDRRAIADDVEELAWVAVCKPPTWTCRPSAMTSISSSRIAGDVTGTKSPHSKPASRIRPDAPLDASSALT